jgi:hypothetical protein
MVLKNTGQKYGIGKMYNLCRVEMILSIPNEKLVPLVSVCYITEINKDTGYKTAREQ